MSVHTQGPSAREATTLEQAWQTLVEGGVPLGPAHPRTNPPAAALLADALCIVMNQAALPVAQDAEALFATLRAWQAHWPSSFAGLLGGRGLGFLDRLEPSVKDRNRYLKLRRIALSHLARVL
ncbi:MAG: hypothetical protein HY303_04010 [Candidatus Wallbacteria bacterium]|nr:hypothetical protein [Candidatus Wallbacteria bacterium]